MKSIEQVAGRLIPELRKGYESLPQSHSSMSLFDATVLEYSKYCDSYNDEFYPDEQTINLIKGVVTFSESSKQGWLIVHGKRGMGKSAVLTALRNASKLLRAERTPMVFTAREIRNFGQNQEKQCMKDNNSMTGADWLMCLQSIWRYVAIDDLGAEIPPEWKNKNAAAEGCVGEGAGSWGIYSGPLSSVLEERYRNGLRTIITTNEDRKFMRRFYGERVEHRLHQEGYITCLNLSGDNFRDHPGKERWEAAMASGAIPSFKADIPFHR